MTAWAWLFVVYAWLLLGFLWMSAFRNLGFRFEMVEESSEGVALEPRARPTSTPSVRNAAPVASHPAVPNGAYPSTGHFPQPAWTELD